MNQNYEYNTFLEIELNKNRFIWLIIYSYVEAHTHTPKPPTLFPTHTCVYKGAFSSMDKVYTNIY